MDPNSPEYLAYYNGLAPSTRAFAPAPGSAQANSVAGAEAASPYTFQDHAQATAQTNAVPYTPNPTPVPPLPASVGATGNNRYDASSDPFANGLGRSTTPNPMGIASLIPPRNTAPSTLPPLPTASANPLPGSVPNTPPASDPNLLARAAPGPMPTVSTQKPAGFGPMDPNPNPLQRPIIDYSSPADPNANGRLGAPAPGGPMGASAPLSPMGPDYTAHTDQVRDAMYRSMMSNLEPDFASSRRATIDRLANQGLVEGSDAYTEEMNRLDRSQAQARQQAASSATTAAGSEAGRLYGQSLGTANLGLARDTTGLNAGLRLRELGLTEDNQGFQQLMQMIAASRGGVNLPQFGSPAPLDVRGAYDILGNNNAVTTSANNARNTGLFNLGATLLSSYFQQPRAA